ncbi:NADPH-dependent FMN reductase [Flagellimonas algicola]|uniref:NAD(P)H-dependent oxidoreductase n=1 Tax=Flagellimonas algicola TaxID=2583815 RepID=A0ABY2WKL5_9FLAO|nr:NADPH-dependent FMN reductase [Allomuricauda algicola]TMU55111.1 NAD(P)H-dependent oxidoreductase [Allomuricauda algicola]
MKKILALAGSNSPNSINEKLMTAALEALHSSQIKRITSTTLDVPLYSPQEEEKGLPKPIKLLFKEFALADGFIVASPEHNGLPTAFLKNLIDWISRIDQKFFGDKPVLLLSTSPGYNGGASNLKVLEKLLPIWGGNLTDSYSLGSFNHNFDPVNHKITNEEVAATFDGVIQNFLQTLHS